MDMGMGMENVSYRAFLDKAREQKGIEPLIVPVTRPKGVELRLQLAGAMYCTYVHQNTEEMEDYLANVKPRLNSGRSEDGYLITPAGLAGPQAGIELELSHLSFELMTDDEWSNAGNPPVSLDSPAIEYNKLSLDKSLYLAGANIAFQDIPRFTKLVARPGFYPKGDITDEADFYPIGRLTSDNGLCIAGTNDTGTDYPPQTLVWNAARIPNEISFPAMVPDGNGGEVQVIITRQVYVRVVTERVRLCLLDSNGQQIKPYVDIDLGFFNKTE